MNFIKKNTILLLIFIFSSLNINCMQEQINRQSQQQAPVHQKLNKICFITQIILNYITPATSIYSIDSTKENLIKCLALTRATRNALNLIYSAMKWYKEEQDNFFILIDAIDSIMLARFLLKDYRIMKQACALAAKNNARKNDINLKNQKTKQCLWWIANVILPRIIEKMGNDLIAARGYLLSWISEIIRQEVMYSLIESQAQKA